jgi:protein-L-isoaspartate O-methyltransferase
MPDFVTIPSKYLASIATDCERIPKLYFHGNPVLRRQFWLRLRVIHRMILEHAPAFGACLDFGGGGGVFAPTLAATFERVVLADLITTEARTLIADLGLNNVMVAEGDACVGTIAGAPFDVAVAADVLEHFREPDVPVRALLAALRPGGILVTSLPTENWLYRMLRLVFRVEKPDDHYHDAYEVEAAIAAAGFRRLATRGIPLGMAPLFLVTCWVSPRA